MKDRTWTLAPIEQRDGVVRACIVIEPSVASPLAPFITVDETIDAVGYLGCLADGRLQPVRWLVIWLAKAPSRPLGGTALDLPASNPEVLRRWNAAWRPWDDGGPVGPALCIPGQESCGPVLLLDRNGGDPTPLTYGRERLKLELCDDDALLAANEHPTFSATTHRFLVSRPAQGSARFVWLSGSEQPDGVPTVVDAAEAAGDCILFNAGPGLLGAGPIRMTQLDPIGFIDHCSLLHGEPLRSALRFTPSPRAERTALEAAASPMLRSWLDLAERRTPATDAGRLFGAGDPLWLRELEVCYLRVRAVADMVASVRDSVERSGHPLFNVAPEAFAVETAPQRDGLPFLWQARVRLARPGVARTFTVDSDPPLRLFARPAAASLDSLVPMHEASAFLAEGLILDVSDAGSNRIALKIQIAPRQVVSVSETDLLRFTLRVGEHFVPILAKPLRAIVGRQVFEARSLPFSPPGSRPIRAGANMSMTVETVPLEGTPHDLYALFVIACRTLLAGGHPTAHGTEAAAEEAETLARLRDALGVDTGAPESGKGALFESPAELHPLLHPAPLRASADDRPTWPAGIPPALWSDLLRALASMRPGWPGCPCRNFADFDPELAARVFDASEQRLEALARRLRILILGERSIDAEIRRAALDLLAAG